MKLKFSFLLCSVLIYGTLLCSNVTADEIIVDEETDGSHDDEPCIVQHLKSKGKLPNDFPSPKASSLCRFTMIEVFRIVKEGLRDKMKQELPNKVDCIMEMYEQNETADIVLKIAIVKTTDSLTEDKQKTLLESPLNELKEHLTSTAKGCGIDGDTFMQHFRRIFETRHRP